MHAPLAPRPRVPWVALVDKTGPEGQHGRAARARALAQALSDLGLETVNFRALPKTVERTGLLGSLSAAVLGANRIVHDVRAEARRRGCPPRITIISNAQLALVARQLHKIGWTVWAELHLVEGEFGPPSPIRSMLDQAEHWLIDSADRVMCLSEMDAARIGARHSIPTTRLTVVPLTVEPHWLERCHAVPAARRMLFVGSWHHAPNREAIRFLVEEMLPALQARDARWRLVIAGNGIPGHYRMPQVEILSNVPDVRTLVDAAMVCVAPLWTGGGVRTKVLEAMSRARPVVATAIAMEGIEAVPGTDYLAAETADEFARAAERLAADRGLAEQIGARGRSLVEAAHSPVALRAALQTLFA